MGLTLGLGNGIPFKRGGINRSSYWATRIINSLTVLTTGSTTQTITPNISGSGFDEIIFEYCYNNYPWQVGGSNSGSALSMTGLPANTYIYWRARLRKGTNYSPYCTVASDVTQFSATWFLSGGIASANCIGAYTPYKAASKTASYVNQAQPGTYDIIEGTAYPTWSAVNGWAFNGALSQYLKTGIVPLNNQTYSMVILYDNHSGAGTQMLAGLYESATEQFGIALDPTHIYGYNGANQAFTDSTHASGILTIAGNDFYENKTRLGGVGGGSGSIAYDIWIGQTHYSSDVNFFTGNIKALAIYNKELSATEIGAIVDSLTAPTIDSGYVTELAKRQAYVDNEFGSLICFDMATFRTSAYEVGLTNGDVDIFAPTGLDIDNWLDACVSAGMKYAILTTKHHCGFKLWVSASKVGANAVYGINSTTWYSNNGEQDIVDLFVTGCRARGLKIGLYYSIWDTTYEAQVGAYTWAGYIAMIEAELTELLTNYGDIDSLWLDGWQWHITYANIPYATIYNFVKGKQANCVVMDNSHTYPSYTSEIDTYEKPIDGHIPAGNVRLAEEIDTIRNDGKWFYHSDLGQTASQHYTKSQINALKAQIIARNGTYLLGLTPGTDGALPSAQKTLLESLTT